MRSSCIMKLTNKLFNCSLFIFIMMYNNFAFGGEWKFPLHLTYVSGLNDVTDAIEKNFTFSDSVTIPIGISIDPYYEFDNNFGIGTSIGPAVYGAGDISFFILPLGLDFRYAFEMNESWAPYLRAGGKLLIENGDLLVDSSPGFTGGVGVEFNRDSNVSFGVEVLYDGSEVEITQPGNSTVSVKPFEFTVSIFLSF